jgi:hypothetical protein
VGCIDACFVSDDTMENLPQPTHVGQTKVGAIDLNKPRMRRVADAVLALSSSPTGRSEPRAASSPYTKAYEP